MVGKIRCRLQVIFAVKKQEDRSFNQGKFAKKVGISGTTLSSIANEKSVPTLGVALRIAKELDLHIEDIWWEESE